MVDFERRDCLCPTLEFGHQLYFFALRVNHKGDAYHYQGSDVIELQYRIEKKKKSSRERLHQHQRLPCPACHFERLIDSGQDTQSLTFVIEEPGYYNADYYQKCSSCKADIGIKKIK